MKSKTFKKLTAMMIAVMLVFSMCVTGISASAAVVSDGTRVVYLKPNSNWTQKGARFAVYLYQGSTNKWTDMSDEDGDGYYEATLPEGEWDKIIFCRMNPGATENNWNNKWNQTSDLDIPDGMNCYLVADGTWDKGGGQWVAFTPGEEPSTEATTAPSYKYTVAGEAGLCGVAWTPASAENALTDEDGDGVYEITYSNVAAGTYSFKVTDGTWNNAWGGSGTSNYSFTLNSAADVTIKFTEATKAIEVVSTGMGSFVLKHMTVVGDVGLVGANWNPAAAEGVMTQDENGVWTITFSNVAAGQYKYKFVANDNYTYNWTVEGYFNSSGNSVVDVENEGADVTLTIDVSGYDFDASSGNVVATATVTGGTPTEPVETTAPVTDPTEPLETTAPVTDPTEPVAVDYYLFGYINGANYASGDDYANMGEYKFVNNEVTATFTETSYVGVKTTDNGAWYMTDGWAGEVTEVTLYNAAGLGETADKLMVPAGKVKFTLVVNDDDTLTLSYTVLSQPTTEPVETTVPATEPVTTEPATTEPVTVPANDVSVFGDINLTLADNGSGVYTGVTELEAGTYTFKINNMGTTYCNGSTFTDKTAGATYNSKWTSATTLKASGGTYTFKYDTTTNKLAIGYKAPSLAQIFGDINLDLEATKDANIYSAAIELEAGEYSFRVMNQDVQYCCGYTFNDKTRGAQYKSTWKSASILNAKGGSYTFSYDIDANKLTIAYVPAGAECGIVGDLTITLDKTATENVYSATKEVKAGTYQIKVSNSGKICGGGLTVNNSTRGIVLNPKFSKYVIFNAAGGTYTFTYNTASNTLVVAPEKTETVVKVTGDIDLTLSKSDDENVYTGTTTLDAGTYQFKMNVDGKDFCCGNTIKNTTTGLTYKSVYKSSTTMNALGGTYTFSYNVSTNVLSITYTK